MNPLFPRLRLRALVWCVACGCLLSGCKRSAPKEEEEEHHAAPVKWDEIKTEPLAEWVELLGSTTALPDHVARVSSAVAAPVLEVLPEEKGKRVVEGDEVKAGRLLVRLDDRLLRANRAKLVVAEEELKELVEQANQSVELARIDVKRLERLQTGGGNLPPASQVELDKARVGLLEVQARQRAARAKIDTSQAEIKALDEQLGLYSLRAPIPGRLGLVHAVPGQSLAAGEAIADIVDLDTIDVLCYVPASVAGRLRPGQEARLPDVESAHGKVVFVADQAQADSGIIAVKVQFANKDLGLRAGVSQRVLVQVERKEKARAIPDTVLMEDQAGDAVLVAVPGEKNNKGEETFTAHRYLAQVGLRDRMSHKIELIALTDPETRKAVPFDDKTRFIAEGGHGLEDGDLVKEEEEEHHDEPKDKPEGNHETHEKHEKKEDK